MPASDIVIRGAREHNLQNVSVTLPRNKLIVMTGVSGSGKSSLAFDTLYAEGQRRYVESLSSYARQFLGHLFPGSAWGRMGPPPKGQVGLAAGRRSDHKTAHAGRPYVAPAHVQPQSDVPGWRAHPPYSRD